MVKRIAFFTFFGLMIAACGSNSGATPTLSLADDKPTFVYFYTDG